MIRDVSDFVQAKRNKNRLMNKLFGAQKSQFFAGMCASKVPLIRGLAGQISDAGSSDVTKLQVKAKQIEMLASDLMHIDQEGRLPLTPVEPESFVRTVLEQLPKTFSIFQQVELDMELYSGELVMRCAPDELKTCLQNLLLLAARETGDADKVWVESLPVFFDQPVHGTEVIPAGEYMALRIHDGGEGIPEAELDRFFSGQDSRHEDVDLALTESLIRHMGGILDVDSTIGKGTTISIYLKIARGPFTAQTPKDPQARILVVEDHPQQQTLLQYTLWDAGCLVDVVSTGEAALEMLGKFAFDVVLLDLVLADDLHPKDFTFRQIQNSFPQTPVVVTCGEVDSHVLSGVVQAGAAGFVEKPVDNSKLIRTLKREWMLAREGA